MAGLSVQGAGENRHSLNLLAPLRDGGCPDGCDLGQGCDGGADSCGTDGCGEDVSKGKCGKCWESDGKICVSVCVKIDNPEELCFGDSVTTEEDLIDGSAKAPKAPKKEAAAAAAPAAVADPAVAPVDVAVAPVDPIVAPEPEIMSDQEREATHNHPPDGKKLPTGTCKATNPDLKGKKAAQLLWNNWCDEVCVESDYGGLGADACVDATGTGAVGCVCKQGVKLIDIYKNGIGPTGAGAVPAEAAPAAVAPVAAAPVAAVPAPVAAVPAAAVPAAVAPAAVPAPAVVPVPQATAAPAPTVQPATTAVPIAPVAEVPVATAVAPPLPTDSLDPNDKTDYSKCVSTVQGTTDFWCATTCATGTCPANVCLCGDDAAKLTKKKAAAAATAKASVEADAAATAKASADAIKAASDAIAAPITPAAAAPATSPAAAATAADAPNPTASANGDSGSIAAAMPPDTGAIRVDGQVSHCADIEP